MINICYTPQICHILSQIVLGIMTLSLHEGVYRMGNILHDNTFYANSG